MAEQRRLAADVAQANVYSLARLTASNHQRLIDATRQLLDTLTYVDEVKGHDPEACNQLLSTLLGEHPIYTNLSVVNTNGDVWCSALSMAQSVSQADQVWFQETIKTHSDVLGGYQIGRISGQPGLPIAHPVVGQNGEIVSVLSAGLKLDWLNNAIAQAHLPTGSTFDLIDEHGVILTHYPNPESWAGHTLAEDDLFRAITQLAGNGTVVGRGVDGEMRLFGLALLQIPPDIGRVYLAIGIPYDAVIAQVNLIAQRNLAALLLFFSLALILAWVGGRIFFLRPFTDLLKATKQLSANDLTARAHLMRGAGELSELASAFNNMADELERRQKEQARIAQALHESNERYRAVSELTSDYAYSFQVDPDGALACEWVTDAFERLAGHKPEELGPPTSWAHLVHPDDMPVVQRHGAILLAGQPDIRLFRVIAQDGQVHWLRNHARPILNASGTRVVRIIGAAEDATGQVQAGLALSESERRLREMLENVQLLAVVLDTEGRVQFCNEFLVHMSGWSRDELVGQDWFKCCIAAESRQDAKTVFRKVMLTGDFPVSSESEMITRDGMRRTIFWSNTLLRDRDGGIAGTTSIGQDITEQRQAEQRLRQSEERYRAFVEHSTEAVWCFEFSGPIPIDLPVDAQIERLYSLGHVVECNEVMARSYGCNSPQDAQGLPLSRIIPSFSETNTEYLRTFVTNQYRAIDIESIEVVQENDFRYYLNHLIGIVENGHLVRAWGVKRDVTARKRAEQEIIRLNQELEQRVMRRTAQLAATNQELEAEATERRRIEAALRISESQWRQLFEQANDSIFVVNDDDEILDANARACEMFGYSRAELLTMKVPDLQAPEMRGRVGQVIRSELGLGRIVEATNQRKDGVLIPVEISTRRIAGTPGNAVLAIVRDITERKRAEQEMRVALAQERELSELRARFVSTTSHEFRTPLSTILSSAQLLELYGESFGPEKRKTYLRRVQSAVQHMAELLDSILVIAKVEAGAVQSRPEVLDLPAFCADLVEEMQLTDKSRHQIELRVHGENTSVCLDDKLLRQILQNLLSNALKYSPPSRKIGFDLMLEKDAVTFRIEDQGVGIPEDEQGRIGELFYRASNVADIAGSGLGLAIVRRTVAIQNGTLSLESHTGTGTVVTVSLPAQQARQV